MQSCTPLTMATVPSPCLALTLPPLPLLSDQASLLKTHYFSDTANWVVPGHVMQGQRPDDEDEVGAIVGEGGCGTFVCLQAESPPQLDPSDTLGGANDWRDERMSGYFDPYGDEVIAAVAAAAAAAAPNGGPKARPPPAFVHYGIRDMAPAESLGGLSDLIDNLGQRVRSGETLYLHCWGGRGRAGLVAACLLGELYGEDEPIDAEEALDRVGAYCRLRSGGEAGSVWLVSPETDAQRNQVREFFEYRKVRGPRLR